MDYNSYKKKIKKEKLLITIIQLSIVLFFFLLWELLAKGKLIDGFLFSCPSEIIKLLVEDPKEQIALFFQLLDEFYDDFGDDDFDFNSLF